MHRTLAVFMHCSAATDAILKLLQNDIFTVAHRRIDVLYYKAYNIENKFFKLIHLVA